MLLPCGRRVAHCPGGKHLLPNLEGGVCSREHLRLPLPQLVSAAQPYPQTSGVAWPPLPAPRSTRNTACGFCPGMVCTQGTEHAGSLLLQRNTVNEASQWDSRPLGDECAGEQRGTRNVRRRPCCCFPYPLLPAWVLGLFFK